MRRKNECLNHNYSLNLRQKLMFQHLNYPQNCFYAYYWRFFEIIVQSFISVQICEEIKGYIYFINMLCYVFFSTKVIMIPNIISILWRIKPESDRRFPDQRPKLPHPEPEFWFFLGKLLTNRLADVGPRSGLCRPRRPHGRGRTATIWRIHPKFVLKNYLIIVIFFSLTWF